MAKRRKPARRVTARTKVLYGPGVPTQRKFPTAPDKSVTLPSGIRYKTSTVWVGCTPDALSHAREERIIKLCAERARRWYAKNEGPVQATVKALFAQTLPLVLMGDGTVQEIPQYDNPDDFPDVGNEWEWRDQYRIGITFGLDELRGDLRKQFKRARDDNQDNKFVFLDCVKLGLFYAK